ncbi:MAG: hypothetical protein R2769_03880 [Saprospiraceae bacterium]
MLDEWIFNYDTGSQQDLLESKYTVSYRDALSVPFLPWILTGPNLFLRVGDCFTRNLEQAIFRWMYM